MRLAVLLLCLLALTPAARLHAQQQVHLEGIVVDDANRAPIADARVEVFDGWGRLNRSRRTDTLGHFRLPLRRLGAYRIRVRVRGYPEVSQVVLTEAYPYTSIEVRVRKGAQLLAPITILGRAQSLPRPDMAGFHHRLRDGKGSFVTRDDVESTRPGHISDMIAWSPGVAIRRAGASGDDRLLIARRVIDGRLTECPLRVLVDGELVNSRTPAGEVAPVAIDAMVDQSMVDGIETYVDAAAVPAELRNAPAGCGAIAVWTKTGAGAGRPPAVNADN
ncbi:MAG TPA: carboxypeptidase regulatory-like domain-containing protein [Longimicrobium sp.]|nr:carboxypeptidase regulatory-like domain-containing protein [Longimicrobium sp.]